MSRLDDLEKRVAALEEEIGTRRGRPSFDTRAPHFPVLDLTEGPYGYGSQDR